MLSFFPQDVLDEVLDLVESVSEGFPTYSFQVMSLLDQLGFTYIWNSQNITKLQLNMVIQCVYDQYYIIKLIMKILSNLL